MPHNTLSHNVSMDLPLELVPGTLNSRNPSPERGITPTTEATRSAKKTDSLPPGGILKTGEGIRVALSAEDFNVLCAAIYEREANLKELGVLVYYPEITDLIDRIEGKA